MTPGAMQNDPVQGAFRALADPTRRQILVFLSQRDMTIGEVAGRFDMTRAAVKKHLTILGEGGLISVVSSGREKINRLEPAGLKCAADWLTYFDGFWDDRLADLRSAIEQNGDNDNE
jgi:DNA-binding transcriptional ArsR family regulator